LTALTAQPDDASRRASPRSLWADAWVRFRQSRLALAMLVVVGLYVAVALGVQAGLIAADWNEPVGAAYQPPSWEHPMGTDIFGQSVLRKTLYGAKISLTVATFASLISLAIGVPLGAVAGYFGGIVDELVVWFYSTLSSIPGFLLLLAFAVVLRDKTLFGQPLGGITSLYLAIGLTSWVGICRLIRGEVIKHKGRDYVTAASAYGASKARIIFSHVLPNVTHLVLIDFSLRFVAFIHAEVILSFFGLGAKGEPSRSRRAKTKRLAASWVSNWPSRPAKSAVAQHHRRDY